MAVYLLILVYQALFYIRLLFFHFLFFFFKKKNIIKPILTLISNFNIIFKWISISRKNVKAK
jgi:hypothetical protein